MNRGFEFTFNWLFSIVIGASILFLAFYASQRLVETEQIVTDSALAVQFGQLLNPLRAGVTTFARASPIIFPEPVRLVVGCESGGQGSSSIRVDSESRDQAEGGYSASFDYLYIFGSDSKQRQGDTKIQVLVVPFNLPYRVADALVLYTGSYCFVRAPTAIQEELGNDTIVYRDALGQCPQRSKTVCFGQMTGCGVSVDVDQQIVRTQGASLYYTPGFLYPALFSDGETYECQMRRLFYQTRQLAELYALKSTVIASQQKGCATGMESKLHIYGSLFANQTTRSLPVLYEQGEQLDKEVEALQCPLW